ncbi:MAG: 4Fe-4S binding protein, partial [Planctomycetota bacterium]
PAWSIRKAAEEEPGTGYPLVEPNVTSCALCEDPVPCIVACQTGALVMTPRASIRLGLVRLERSLCVVPLGQACDFCVTYCPVSDEAIRMSEEGPVISESACTGCGMCVVMCPEDALRVGAVEGAW